MAHELTIAGNRAEMAYVGDTPWHGLGQVLQAGADLDTWRAAAGMAWTIESAPVQYLARGQFVTSPDKVALFRSDSGAELGIVSDGYNIVQPAETLEFFDEVSMKAGFTLETAGTLFGGKRFWALANIGAEAQIADASDRMRRYLLLASSADGSLATTGKYVDIRVVCNNTLSAARNEKKAATSIRVSHRSVFDAASARKALGIDQAHDEFQTVMAEFRRMAETKANPVQTLLRTAELFTPGFNELDRAEQIKLIEKPTSPTKRIGELWLNKQARGSNLAGTNGTAWGWLNAVTEYVDHESRSRTADRRLESAWYGPGEKIKEQARQVAVEMVQADGTTRTVFQTVAVAEPVTAPIIEQHGSIDIADILAASPAFA